MNLPDGFDLDALLAPIPGDFPQGEDVREDYSAQSPYSRLRDARSNARDAEKQAETPDPDGPPPQDPVPLWRGLRDIGLKLLTEKTKDLEVAAWLTEAYVRSHGLSGLAACSQLIAGLVTRYWDDVFPLPDEYGTETRVAPVTGLNGQGGGGSLMAPLFKLPLSPRLEACGIVVEKCKVMDSKKLPLWLAFENPDPSGDPIYVIFKAGDDLRQDLLTLQMLKIMDSFWKQQDLDLQLIPYGCIATGDGVGMIEVVLNSETIAHITSERGGASAAFSEDPLLVWLKAQNSQEGMAKVVENFVRSCAGYCVATYVLGIGDRHNDNIMLTRSGILFHVSYI